MRRAASHARVGAAIAVLAALAIAQAGAGTYSVPRDRIAAGAAVASGPTYRVAATVGQHEAGPELAGPTYRLRGGYVMPTSAPIIDALFADGFEP